MLQHGPSLSPVLARLIRFEAPVRATGRAGPEPERL
jgi:hypothetical protein